MGYPLLVLVLGLVGAGLALALETLVPGLTALALAGALVGFALGLAGWRYEVSEAGLLFSSLLCGFWVAVAYTMVKVLVYALGLEAAGTATVLEVLSMMIGSGVLLTMLVINGIVAAITSAMGAVAAMFVRGAR